MASSTPPDLPFMSDVSPKLSDYLRRFALWARQSFADTVPVNEASPSILLQADDTAAGTPPSTTATVFKLSVKSDGTLVVTPVPLGGGRP